MAETGTQRVTNSRRTLGLVGLTIHAMTLIAPGAFVWLMFPLQLSFAPGGIWPGVLLALVAAFLTSAGFSSLAARYPEASNYSAYHYLQRVFNEKAAAGTTRWSPLAKFLTGWSAHLFYWVYPGVIVAFMTTLVVYLLRQYGYQPTPFGQALLAAALAAFLGFLGLRGISGSMTSSILLNVLQIVIVVVFSTLALAFRLMNPLQAAPEAWLHPQPLAILLPPNVGSLLAQAALSIFLVIGFESVVSLGVASANPRRDIPRGTILALLIQGLLAYSVQYFAFNFAIPAEARLSAAPLGDLAVAIGDHLLSGNGFTLMMVVAASVMVAALAAGLTSINTAVRTTFAMAMDAEMPEFLSLLHDRYATPYYAVLILTVVSGVIGILGTLGGLNALIGITLAANLGAFLLYGIVCALTLTVSLPAPARTPFFSRVLSLLGVLINLGLAGVIVWLALSANPGAQIAIVVALVWFLVSAAYYRLNALKQRRRAA